MSESGLIDLNQTDKLLSTTRSVRKRLDLERHVPESVIVACLTLAVQAPTGSNEQGWRWLVVTDPDKRRELGRMYSEEGRWAVPDVQPHVGRTDGRHQGAWRPYPVAVSTLVPVSHT